MTGTMMCAIAEERLRINTFLENLLADHAPESERDFILLKEFALELFCVEYGALCPDQCVRTRIESFFSERAIAIEARAS